MGNVGQQHHLSTFIPHTINAMSYPAMHNSGGFFGTIFHPGTGILGVSSHCSFNSVTNFIT